MGDWLYGKINSEILIKNIILEINLFDQIKELNTPIVFLQGRHDYNTYYGTIEEYYTQLKANKKIYWFDKSGHCPNYEENGLFNKIVISEK